MKNTTARCGVGFFSGDSTMSQMLLFPVPASHTPVESARSLFFYRFTASNAGSKKFHALLSALPAKYASCAFDAASIDGVEVRFDTGSGCVWFKCDSVRANALRKFLARRFKGRGKFARMLQF
jgi:hypothetical protein